MGELIGGIVSLILSLICLIVGIVFILIESLAYFSILLIPGGIILALISILFLREYFRFN